MEFFKEFQNKMDLNPDREINLIEGKISRKKFKKKGIIIKYKLKIENDNNDCYYYNLINKDLIINNFNLDLYNKQEINNNLNYIDNNNKIPIENNEILLKFFLEDDKRNHCNIPIIIYEEKNNNIIYNNIIIFSIIIYD